MTFLLGPLPVRARYGQGSCAERLRVAASHQWSLTSNVPHDRMAGYVGTAHRMAAPTKYVEQRPWKRRRSEDGLTCDYLPVGLFAVIH